MIGIVGIWRVGYHIVDGTVTVAPNVKEVEPMPYFMGSSSPSVKWSLGMPKTAKKLKIDHNTIGSSRPAWHLSVTHDVPFEVANPNVEVMLGRPGINTARFGKLDVIVGRKIGIRSIPTAYARSRISIGRPIGELKLQICMGSLWPGTIGVRIQASKIFVQYP